jgi:hypothetical protein
VLPRLITFLLLEDLGIRDATLLILSLFII